MTLAVSLRVPDGLIIAADSLATTMGQIGVMVDADTDAKNVMKKLKLKGLRAPLFRYRQRCHRFPRRFFHL